MIVDQQVLWPNIRRLRRDVCGPMPCGTTPRRSWQMKKRSAPPSSGCLNMSNEWRSENQKVSDADRSSSSMFMEFR